MARDAWAYREVAVQLLHGRISPMPGQAFASTLRVHCSRQLLSYPEGSCFLLSAKLTDRGGQPYLYAWHGDPVRALSAREAKAFLGQYRRLRL